MNLSRQYDADGTRLCFESVWERDGLRIAVFPVSSDDPAKDEHDPDEHLYANADSVIRDVSALR